MSGFKTFKEQLPTKNNCIVPLLEKNSDKHYEHVLRLWESLKEHVYDEKDKRISCVLP